MIEIAIESANPSIPLNAIMEIIEAALEAANPYRLVADNLEFSQNSLRIGDQRYALYPESRIVVVGLGKASTAMCQAANDAVEDQITKGVCICKHVPTGLDLQPIEIFESAHPIPDERSITAAVSIKECVSGLTEKDMVLFLLSGGGSALACMPAEGITLTDIQQVTGLLLKNGATINEMNCVRKHLDNFKGGGFLRMVQLARMGVLVLSDVLGNPLDVIASGPAVEDPSSFKDARMILHRYCSDSDVPPGVMRHIENGCKAEARISVEARMKANRTAYHKIIGSNALSVEAACQKAMELGYDTKAINVPLSGEARLAGEKLLTGAPSKPFAVFAGGETTVTVTGAGMGGRNLEMALGSVDAISKLTDTVLVTFATDGEDGPTDTAGAVVCSESTPDYTLLEQSLRENDSYTYFKKTGGLIRTGSTGTNVNDIAFVIGY